VGPAPPGKREGEPVAVSSLADLAVDQKKRKRRKFAIRLLLLHTQPDKGKKKKKGKEGKKSRAAAPINARFPPVRSRKKKRGGRKKGKRSAWASLLRELHLPARGGRGKKKEVAALL